jgi:uncharacterized protein with NRDE domain
MYEFEQAARRFQNAANIMFELAGFMRAIELNGRTDVSQEIKGVKVLPTLAKLLISNTPYGARAQRVLFDSADITTTEELLEKTYDELSVVPTSYLSYIGMQMCLAGLKFKEQK